MTLHQRLPDFRLEEYFSRWEFAAQHNLAASDVQTLTVHEILEMASADDRAAFSDLPLGYTPTWGGDELRSAIAATYENLSADDVLVFAGAEEAVYWAMQVLVAPGEHAILTVPNYQSMETITLLSGIAASGVVLDSANEWRLDVDDIRRAWRPNTTLVAVNFPNNPTGALPDHETWLELIALCEERGARLFSDEVYRGIEIDRSRTLIQAADASESAVSLNVMSKAYGLPGLRIGWIATRDHQVLEMLEKHKHYTSMCNSAPSEALATMALLNSDAILDRNRARIVANLRLFTEFFDAHSDLFEWAPPAGGCVSFPKYLGADGVENMCRSLVETAGVILLPASLFASSLGAVPADRFRIGLGRDDAARALSALDAYLRTQNPGGSS